MAGMILPIEPFFQRKVLSSTIEHGVIIPVGAQEPRHATSLVSVASEFQEWLGLDVEDPWRSVYLYQF